MVRKYKSRVREESIEVKIKKQKAWKNLRKYWRNSVI